MEKAHKKNYPLHSVGISIGKFNISPTGKLYVIPSIYFIFPSIYPSVNITYHQQNIICNFVGKLIVAMIFAVILFQLFGIYQRI
jgi:hypothetical protein